MRKLNGAASGQMLLENGYHPLRFNSANHHLRQYNNHQQSLSSSSSTTPPQHHFNNNNIKSTSPINRGGGGNNRMSYIEEDLITATLIAPIPNGVAGCPTDSSESEATFSPQFNGNRHTYQRMTKSIDDDASSCDDDDDDDDDYMEVDGGGKRKRRRRLPRWAIGGVVLLFIFMLMYIPMFTNVQPRRGETDLNNCSDSDNSDNCMMMMMMMQAVPISGWSWNTSRDTTDYILPHANTTLINPVGICRDKVFLLIVVCSSARNFVTRQIIRETWGNTTEFNYPQFTRMHAQFRGKYLDSNFANWHAYAKYNGIHSASNNTETLAQSQANLNTKILFLVGRTNNETQLRLNNESDAYGDLIQESFFDSYNNLTVKTVMMLKWVNLNCGNNVLFLMKCDDDTFVNVPNLLHILVGGTVPIYNATVPVYNAATILATSPSNRVQRQKNLLIGSLFCNAKPVANVSSKWYSPIYMFSGDIYPNYLSGTGYVMSMDVAARLYNVSLSTPLFHLEDVYLTGICAKRLALQPHNHPLFTYTTVKNYCELRGMVSKHELNASQLRKAYQFVVNDGVSCPGPNKHLRLKKIRSRLKEC